MFLTKFDPFEELRTLEKRFLGAFEDKKKFSDLVDFVPSVNTRDGEYAYHIEVDIPGVKKEDIHVDLTDDVLTISGDRKTKKEVKEKDFYKMESSYGKFQRSFTVPKGVDLESIKAVAEDGVLEVTIPKLERDKTDTKKIEVQ